MIVKKSHRKIRGARGGSRIRDAMQDIRKSKNGQRLALHQIIKHFEGLTQLSKKSAQILGVKEFAAQNWSNWRQRGGMPMHVAIKLAKGLKLDPLLLNYSELKPIFGDTRSWKQVVETAPFDKEIKKQILSYRAPE